MVLMVRDQAGGILVGRRNLKPENIVLTRDGGRTVPKILDFGLAKFVQAIDLWILDIDVSRRTGSAEEFVSTCERAFAIG